MMGSSAKPQVLLVEDHAALVRLTTAMLSRDFEVVACTSGLAALHAFASDPATFAAAVLDWQLPDLSGPDLARHCWLVRPDLPVVLISGDPRLLDTLPVEGPIVGLAKPFLPQELLESLRHVRGLP